jgi:hypothetical protein
MSGCDDFELDVMVFGGLTAEAAGRARTHLARCARCREEHARLMTERELFATRRVHLDGRKARVALPDVDAIFARVASTPPSFFARFASALARTAALMLDTSRAARPGFERLLMVAAVAAILIGVVRRRPSVAVEAATVSPPAASHAAPGAGAAPRAADACASEELVCRETFRFVVERDPAQAQSIASDRADTQCGSEQSSMSSVPRAFDRLGSSSAAMCIQNEI